MIQRIWYFLNSFWFSKLFIKNFFFYLTSFAYMKIKVIADYRDDYEGKIIYSINIEDDYDFIIFMEKLKSIDVIRIINLNPIELVVFDTNYIGVYNRESIKNVKFIIEPIKMIEIEDKENKVEIKANVEFKLTIPIVFYHEIDMIDEMIWNNVKFEKYKKAISDEKIQNKSFDILNEYIEKKPLKVIYGRDVIELLKKGLIKVVFLSWNFIKKLDDKLFDELTSIDNKFKNANIVMFWKKNKNYKELVQYEIIGVFF